MSLAGACFLLGRSAPAFFSVAPSKDEEEKVTEEEIMGVKEETAEGLDEEILDMEMQVGLCVCCRRCVVVVVLSLLCCRRCVVTITT